MRLLFLFVFCLLIGGIVGVFVDRHEQSRAWIDDVYKPASLPVASPISAITELKNAKTPIPEFTGIYPSQTLSQFSIKRCFSSEGPSLLPDRPWLLRAENWVELTDLTKPESFPNLAEHAGLVKIEIIHSLRGADREHCSAVRVDVHWFLTAAHCIETADPERALPVYDIIMVTPGIDVRAESIKVTPVTAAMCHAEHGVSRLRYPTDIALFYVDNVDAFSEVEIANLEQVGQHLSLIHI